MGEESRTTPILEGEDDEDIAKMESTTASIQEEEDDEDIAMLDTPTPSFFLKLQFISNSATTSLSDSADTSLMFRS